MTVISNVNCVAKTVLPNKIFSFISPECISPTYSVCFQIRNKSFCNLHLHLLPLPLPEAQVSSVLASNDPNELFKYVTRSSEDQRYYCTLCPISPMRQGPTPEIMSRQNISHKPFIIYVTSVTPVLPPRIHSPA